MKNQEQTDEKGFDVTVVYNGLTQSIAVKIHQAVQAVLQHAMNAFGVQSQDLVLAFNGANLDPNAHVGATGITAGVQLLLRPRIVQAGV